MGGLRETPEASHHPGHEDRGPPESCWLELGGMSAITTPIRLSRLTLSSERSLESVLQVRRSVREYARKPLARDELAQ